jgi:hypothetical protein
MAEQIGTVAYSLPRAVQIKADAEGHYSLDGTPHSAVYGTLNVLVDSVPDAQKLMNRWPEIIEAISENVNRILQDGG